jgi:hypothetical protein
MANQISLTNMVIAGLVITFFIGTLFGVYSDLVINNGATIDEPYNTAFQTIAGQYSDYGGLAEDSSDQGLVKNILDAADTTFNVFVVGLNAIEKFFELIPLVGDGLSAISNAIPAFSALFGLITLVITIYVGMRYIQAASNKTDLP